MRRRVLRVLVAILAVPVLLMATVYMFRKELVRVQLENLLQTRVQFEDIYIDLTSDFPMAHISLQGVQLAGTNPAVADTVITCAQADVSIDVWELYFERQVRTVERIRLYGTRLNMVLDKNGVNNFRLFKPYDPNRRRPDEVWVKHLELYHTRLDYAMRPLNRHYALTLDSVKLTMRNWRQDILFKGQLAGTCRYIDLGGFRILTEEPFVVNTQMRVDKVSMLMTFEHLSALVAESDLSLTGKLLMTSERFYDIHFGTRAGKLGALLALLPDKSVRALRPYRMQGNLQLEGSIVGRDDATTNPHINLKFRATDTQILHRQTQVGFRNLKLSGAFTNGDANNLSTTELRIDTLEAMFAGEPIYAQLRLSRFKDLYVQGKLDARVEVARLLQFANVGHLLEGSGRLHANIDLAGAVQYLSDMRETQYVRYNGFLELEAVNLRWRRWPLQATALSGRLDLTGRDLHTQQLAFRLNDQPIAIQAKVKDFLSFAYGQSKVLQLETQVRLDTLYVGKLMGSLEALKAQAKRSPLLAGTPTPERLLRLFSGQLPGFIQLEAQVVCPVVQVNPILSTSFDAAFALAGHQLTLHHLKLGGSQSLLDIHGTWHTAHASTTTFDLTIDAHSHHLQDLLLDIRALPPVLERATSPVEVKGTFQIKGNIMRRATLPQYDLQLYLKDGKVAQPDKRILVEDLQATTHLTEAHLLRPLLSQLQIDSISGLANQFPFKATLRLVDLFSLNAQLLVSSTIGADVFLRYFSIPQLADATGVLDFEVTLNGNLKDMADPNKLVRMPESGYLTISNGGVLLKPSGLPIRGLEARMHYDGKGVRILYMNGQMASNHFAISGQVKDILPYLYTDNAPLIGNITYVGDTLDLESFAVLGNDTPTNPDSAAVGTAKRTLKMPEHADLRAEVFVQHAFYQKLRMEQVQVDAQIKDRLLIVRKATMQTCGGSLEISGNVDNTDPLRPLVFTELNLQHVEVRQLFEAFDALDEQKLDSLGIAGRVSLKGRLLERVDIAQKQLFLPKLARFQLEVTDGYVRDLSLFLKPNPLLPRKALTSPTHFMLRADSVYWADSGVVMPHIELVSNKLWGHAKGLHDLNGEFLYQLAIRKPSRALLEKADYMHFGHSYDRTLWNFTIKSHPRKGMATHLNLRQSLRNLFGKTRRQQRQAKDTLAPAP